ncbi:MAG TPA: phenylalanine--tRNA ligase subunit beta [Gemmatimonadaceae bacterium]|jgi:phenylalanyl-tRNA synthetase beta chain|nr:phenylalanine--tRNA ligase subunit beta [Gemmatimonadaceae bacterium]
MNVSYEWLKAFVPFDQNAGQLRELITAHVATVDELAALREDLAPIVIARVVEEAPHPDSDHLHVTRVDAGTGTLLDVVCGAPNVAAGRIYPFAPTGTTMPNGLKIQKRKIRGAISDGMLCSARELDLGDEQEGIMELDLDVPPGTRFLDVVPVGDVRIVIDVGANRPDLLSHLGVAREIAAITRKPFALPRIENLPAGIPASTKSVVGGASGSAGSIAVSVAEPDLVRRFMGVVIRGVQVGPSPRWLVQRLEAVGSRSINNVVDASNYVLHEMGQPTHAFDLAKLAESKIIVRRARPGEKITTLDGTERALGDNMIVIADGQRPQAVAGVMGGRDSEVTESTTDVFLEVANFNPTRIRDARRTLGLSTDASYRFERGVDVEIGPRALERVAQLIVLLAGGRIDGAPVDLAYERPAPRSITLRPERVARLLGETLGTAEIAGLLSSVGFDVDRAGDDLRVAVPTWRGDVAKEVDLIEEVARLRGYDSFPTEIRPFRPGGVGDDPQWLVSRRVREALVGAGLLEVRPMPFVAGGEGFIRLENPLAENEAYLRREVLDTLARRAEYNLARMQGNIRIFEIGSVFSPRDGGLPVEELRVGALVMGRRQPAHFTDPKSPDFDAWVKFNEWDAKALAQTVAGIVHPSACIALRDASASGMLWEVMSDDRRIGVVRRVALDAPIWAAPALGIELSLGGADSSDVAPRGQSAYRPFERPHADVRRYSPIPTTPAAEFDLALLVPQDVKAQQVEEVVRRVSGRLLERAELFDRYVGQGVEPGYRSLAWRLTFRHAERTLRDREIDARRSDILKALADELNVRQRTS